ncbi:MAG: AAA family ATPase [Saprospiraceae bacterium]|nr:AAA family ATPase [Saprospiraceae bacterium]
MVQNYPITSHQVSQLSTKEIRKGYIVRKNLLNRTLAKINQTNRTDSVQHMVFVGSRGSGKTLIINRIKAEYEQSDKFITIYLPEEQPGLYRLFDVWLAIIDELNALGYHVQRPMIDLTKENFSYLSKTGYEIIHEFLKKENKQIILLLDNIDRVFNNITNDKALLRELLQNHKDLVIIGGSTEMSEDFWDYGDPFYQFFKIIRLEGLSKTEVSDLLLYWSETFDLPAIKEVLLTNPGKIEAIRQMTGGNPRAMIMFIRLLADNRKAHSFDFLISIIDQTTAIYQERLHQLTPQQRKIVAELAFIWAPSTVDQLVKVCLMQNSLISAQLNKLQKAGIVDAIKPPKGRTVYRLRERLFNLFLIMTQAGTMQKKRAKYLTDFLEDWYNQEFPNQSQNMPHSENTLNEPFAPYFSNKDIFNNEIFSLYKENNKKAALDYLKKDIDQNNNNPFLNIIDLWLGDVKKYHQQRTEISEDLISYKHADIYIQESLVHYQYDWIKQLFDRNEALYQKTEPLYYATQVLHNPASDINTFVPEVLIETVQNILTYVRTRQNFYYTNN